ncbi:unnamed protein product [Fusarium venenatum]|uniref:Uncharacterized protein n=1 Tax=Fusarium venenatum TaxID=56646 RepID=A0A2L2U331_9HYPO|nr:uncharacterized protein FVRRES_09092 [Fusarium venenatum]CEI69015.1 unnamed protein product [Fusarium venenatum]
MGFIKWKNNSTGLNAKVVGQVTDTALQFSIYEKETTNFTDRSPRMTREQPYRTAPPQTAAAHRQGQG